jgi:hypothetical protein
VRAKALVVMAFPVSALLYIARRIRYAFASE